MNIKLEKTDSNTIDTPGLNTHRSSAITTERPESPGKKATNKKFQSTILYLQPTEKRIQIKKVVDGTNIALTSRRQLIGNNSPPQ